MLLPICLLKCWLYVYILLNICPAFMSICLPFLLYVCGFFSKDHAYTSIEDSMAIGDPRVVLQVWFYFQPCLFNKESFFTITFTFSAWWLCYKKERTMLVCTCSKHIVTTYLPICRKEKRTVGWWLLPSKAQYIFGVEKI